MLQSFKIPENLSKAFGLDTGDPIFTRILDCSPTDAFLRQDLTPAQQEEYLRAMK